MNVNDKIELITRNLLEVSGDGLQKMRDILVTRELKIYWRNEIIRKPDIAYFVQMIKIADFLRAGCYVTILFADLYKYLEDYLKTTWKLLRLRVQFYRKMILCILHRIDVNVNVSRLQFVVESDFQLNRDYMLDVYKLSATVTKQNALDAGANPTSLLIMLYPLLQAVDEQYLDIDCQFGSFDQRPVFTFAEQYMPLKRIHLVSPMIPNLLQIGLTDSSKCIAATVKSAYAAEGVITDNALLATVKMVLLPLRSVIDLDGSRLLFTEIEEAYSKKQIHPTALKGAVTKSLIELLEPFKRIELKHPFDSRTWDIRIGQVVSTTITEKQQFLVVNVGNDNLFRTPVKKTLSEGTLVAIITNVVSAPLLLDEKGEIVQIDRTYFQPGRQIRSYPFCLFDTSTF